MMKHRFGYLVAATTLTVVPLAGCDAASEKLSSADACADMIELTLTELREVRENADNPAAIEQSLRDAAEEFRAKAEQVDDPEVKRAARQYADKMREFAEKAAAGQAPEVDAVVQANTDFAESCA